MFCFGFWFKISAVFDWPNTHNMQQGTDFLVLSPCSQNYLICDLTEWTAVIHGHYSEESFNRGPLPLLSIKNEQSHDPIVKHYRMV